MGYGHGRAYAFQALARSLAELPKLFADLRQQRDAALLDKIGSMAMPEGAARSPVQAQPPPFDPAQPDPEQGKGTGLPLTDPSAAPPPTPAAAPSGMPMSGGPMSGAARLRFMADQLRKQGKGALAQQLDAKAQLADKAEWDAQKSRFAAITESFGSRKSGLDLLGRMANGVTDQRGADTARAAMLTVMQQSGFSEPEIQYAQEVAGKPGDPFDPKAWANVVNLTQTHGQTITDQHTALQVVGQSYTNAENKTKAEEAAFTATVKHLLTAPQQYAANRALAVAVDPRMAQVLPPEWNADTETRLTGYLEGIDKTAGLTGTFAGKPTQAAANQAAALKVSQGHLDVARQAEARQAAANAPFTPTGAGGTGASPTLAPGQRHEDYLTSLPSGTANIVKALVEGRQAFPTGMALRAPYWQNMLEAVGRYDPGFDAVNYNARSQARKAFTSGKEAGMVNALNTAIEHMDELVTVSDKLNNSTWNKYNTVANWLSSEFGAPEVNNFNTVVHRVAPELVTAYRAGGGAEADIIAFTQDFSSSNSPAQLRGAVRESAKLLESKIRYLEDQYRQAMGTDAIRVVSPKAQKVLDKLAGGSAPDASPPQVLAAGPGEHTFANGQVWKVSADGKSAERIK